MLDVLVVAPHPDDAELGMAGAIMKFKDDGWRVGILDLTNGEPTPLGTPEIRARETAAATAILGLDWRENLGLPNRSLEATLEARAKLAAVFRLRAAAVDLRAVLGRRPPRSRGGDRIDRGGPLLVETYQDRHAGRAALSATDLLLLLRPPADHSAAGLRAGHQPVLGAETRGAGVLPEPVQAKAGRKDRRRSSTGFATRQPPGDGRSARSTARRSPAASRWA